MITGMLSFNTLLALKVIELRIFSTFEKLIYFI